MNNENKDISEQVSNLFANQLNQLTMLQHQASIYPSEENLTKVSIAADAYETILRCLRITQEIGQAGKLDGKG